MHEAAARQGIHVVSSFFLGLCKCEYSNPQSAQNLSCGCFINLNHYTINEVDLASYFSTIHTCHRLILEALILLLLK